MVWMADNGYLLPKKSSCVGCPFHDDKYWQNLKKYEPGLFQEAAIFDYAIRKLPRIKSECFLHDSLLPLDEAIKCLKEPSDRLFDFMMDECRF